MQGYHCSAFSILLIKIPAYNETFLLWKIFVILNPWLFDRFLFTHSVRHSHHHGTYQGSHSSLGPTWPLRKTCNIIISYRTHPSNLGLYIIFVNRLVLRHATSLVKWNKIWIGTRTVFWLAKFPSNIYLDSRHE